MKALYRIYNTFLMAGTALLFLTGCQENRTRSGTTGDSLAEIPDNEIWDSQVILTSTGRRNAILTAKHIVKFESKKEILVDGVQVDFYDPDGQHSSVLTAEQGTVDEKTNDLEAIKNVVVISDKGVRLETERLFWRNKIQKIISDDFVKITTETDTITGTGLESDPNLEHWEIKKNVKGQFRREVGFE